MLHNSKEIIDSTIEKLAKAQRSSEFSCETNNVFVAGREALIEFGKKETNADNFVSEFNHLIVGIITTAQFTQPYSISPLGQLSNLDGEEEFIKICEEYGVNPYIYIPCFYLQSSTENRSQFFIEIGQAVLDTKKIPRYSLIYDFLKHGIGIEQLVMSALVYELKKSVAKLSDSINSLFAKKDAVQSPEENVEKKTANNSLKA